MRRKYISIKKRNTVKVRARSCCEYCQSQEAFGTENFSTEHIIPISSDGSDNLDNLALACLGCNQFKGVRTTWRNPKTNEITRFFHPRKDKWTEHFKWNEDYSEIIPLTKIGKATVKGLKLNRYNLVNLRIALSLIGEHPPKHTLGIET